MAKGKIVTEDRYSAIKFMINEDLDTSAICSVMGCSEATVSKIRNSQDFEDYQNPNQDSDDEGTFADLNLLLQKFDDLEVAVNNLAEAIKTITA